MLASIIYWAIILVCIAWTALSVWFTIFYLSRKENGNLWAFSLFNVIAAIVLAISLFVFPCTTYSKTSISLSVKFLVLIALQYIDIILSFLS